jgi:hypothetical protein
VNGGAPRVTAICGVTQGRSPAMPGRAVVKSHEGGASVASSSGRVRTGRIAAPGGLLSERRTGLVSERRNQK